MGGLRRTRHPIMVNWSIVTAFIGPLIAAIGLAAAFIAYLNKQREKRISEQIKDATSVLELNQRLTQERMQHFEDALAVQVKQNEKQNDALLAMAQSIARIEGRLSGSVQQGVTNPLCVCYVSVTYRTGFAGRLLLCSKPETPRRPQWLGQ